MTSGALPAGVIDFFLHPPLGGLHPTLDGYGPYTGDQDLTQWSSTAGPDYTTQYVSATYGVVVQLNGTLPPGWTVYKGWTSADGQYEQSTLDPPIAQLVVQHQFPSSFWITSQVVSVDAFPFLVLYGEVFPGRLGLHVAPGVHVDLFYLTAIPV